MRKSEAWERFFSALGVKVTPEGSHVAIDGIGNGWGGGPLRLFYTDFPPAPDVRSSAAILAERAKDCVGFLIGMPHLPTARLTRWSKGGKGAELLQIDKNGVVMLFTPQSLRGEEDPDQLTRDLMWYCIQEDAGGNLALWPMYIESLPVGTEKYSMDVSVPTLTGVIVPTVYDGTGISPQGPRLVRAVQSVSPRPYSAVKLETVARRAPGPYPPGF